MATNGRPPKPTSLKILHGDRPDRINRNEPIPATVEIVRPDWLPEDAAENWDRLAPDLIRQGVLTAWDVDHFAQWCWQVAANRRLILQVEKEGLLVPGERGNRIKNPAMQLIRDTAELMSRYGARFGLTPSDREALSIGDTEQPDAANRLLS